jgi:hypothetical protein
MTSDSLIRHRPRDRAAVFSHEMTSADGTRCLVVVRLSRPRPGTVFDPSRDLNVGIFRITDWNPETANIARAKRIGDMGLAILIFPDGSPPPVPPTPFVPLRMYGGQPNPADPSHLILRFDVGGRPRTLDGWLDRFAGDVRFVERTANGG